MHLVTPIIFFVFKRTTVRDALIAKADYLAAIGDKVGRPSPLRVVWRMDPAFFHLFDIPQSDFLTRLLLCCCVDCDYVQTSALAAYDTALAKTVGAGPRIDVVFGALRVALFTSDAPLLKAKLDDAKKCAAT